ncbi:hypothetical protein H3T19_04590 [Bacteroides fragilis]|jgi:hypothetical protein|uniref:hypothetical protein n=1 Tax=Bacteroides fragilis TaxID=817 RepID=UPI0015F61ED3|nr:hypothetical protein [Bacteroides fragilis]MBA5650031.1 hypothetical protein [Bacteroides fragilis]
MSETKTYVFPESGGNGGGSGMMAMLAPLLQQKGIDPNLLVAMQGKNNNGFGGDGSWFMWIIFLFFLFPLFGRNGFGGNGDCGNGGGFSGAGIPNLINNDAGRELLMSAIQGNGQAINNLATNLNCSIGQVQNAINGVMSQVQQVGNQVGQSSMQIINAIQQGNCNIAQQIASCCCENRLAICQQTNTLQNAINGVATGQERGFASVAYETQRQTCDLQNSIKDSTQQILAGQQAAEMREMQNKIDKLREENSTFKSSAMTSQIVGQATAPLGAALGDLSARLAKIECNQPEVAKVPYSPVVGIPSCVAAQYGLYNGIGAWGNFNGWG